MPPICLHLGIAEEVIARLKHPIVDENLGSFYLGSTAPDIRLLISTTRDETHFMSLDCEDGDTGIKHIFEIHPELANGTGLNAATKSFVAGYLSHLATDESWIFRVYRPYFGKSSSLGDDPMANLLDRLLQFELDRRERLNSKSISEIRNTLTDSTAEVTISFIESDLLKRWCEFVYIATTRMTTWEDFRSFAEKYLIWIRQITKEEQQAFFDSFESRCDLAIGAVPEEELKNFREKAIAESVLAAREYLG